MTRKEIVTPERLKRELTSQRFLSGLAKAVDVTLKNGCETSFDVQKKAFGRKIVYPMSIDVGDTGTAGMIPGLDYAEKVYREETGKEPMDSDGHHSADFNYFTLERDLTSVEYPDVEDKFNWRNLLKDSVGSYYDLIHLHTHPSGHVVPSRADVENNNYSRRRNQVNFGAPFKKTSVIVGVRPEWTERVPILLLHEKPQEPVALEDIDEALQSVYDRTIRSRMLLSSIFLRKHPYHSVGKGYFDRQTGEIDFLKTDFRDFGFRYEV
ncbi:MAG: hypothetical protein KKF56_02750 [Nanoarchaeota archaeon]|nr:hypothetical protein [Nanoarchaeota archaeon]